MRFRPRHYILIAIILALGVYNIVRRSHVHQAPAPSISVQPVAPPTPLPTGPAWTAFDTAAALRDAPEAQFQPSLHELQQQIDTAPPSIATDLDGCKTWLLFYRQSVLHPSSDTTWHNRSAQHIDSCVQHHQDIAS